MRFAKDLARTAVTVVDDVPLALDVLVRATRLWGYECQSAATAEQAVELLAQRPTPIVVTDLRMPGRGGIWLVGEIKRRWPDIGVIVVTAGDDTDAASECLNAGAQRYFLKPIKLDEFRHALGATMHTYQLQREREQYREQLERKVHRQTRRIRHTFLSTIDSFVLALEERDAYTHGHSRRVRDYSLQLADALGLEGKLRQQLSLSAKLHDIGKFGIPEAILNKEDPLSATEYQLIREHPVIGERILAPIIRSRTVLAAIRGHHERMDGGGYPDGLHGDRIPLLARIIAVADCFDAVTCSRAYRLKRSRARALEVLRLGAGTQFDARLVEVFHSVDARIPAGSDGFC